jgi:glutamate-1-semialdehyde 2,1-aminomutase
MDNTKKTSTLSHQYFEKSLAMVPGGVHSPVRSFKSLGMEPIFIKEAQGAKIKSVDGNEYIDFCMSFGPLITGHRDPLVMKAVTGALNRGWSFGAAEPYSLELAEKILSEIGFIDQIRFMNSGTEAVMTAIRLCRGATARNPIIKFEGCYHGHSDSMLIKAGSGSLDLPEASSAGIPKGVAEDTIVLPLNNHQALKDAFERAKKNNKPIAGVIVELLPANDGLSLTDLSFLKLIRQLTKENGALLIADEVITGFRFGMTGLSGFYQLEPDLVTYGKVIGGGFPVAALAGKREIMQNLAPVGGVYQAGTLSANPVTMVAGLALVNQLNEDFYRDLKSKSEKIVEIFQTFMDKKFTGQGQIISEGSLFWPKFHKSSDFLTFFKELLSRGVYLSPHAFEVGFVSTAHDLNIIDELRRALN